MSELTDEELHAAFVWQAGDVVVEPPPEPAPAKD